MNSHLVPRAPCGPEEDYDAQWRTTSTHTAEEMQSVYREIYFAGIPEERRPKEAEALHNIVKQLFQNFGPLTDFYFDEQRGVGAVCFADGDAAQLCYITAQFSRLPLPHGVGEMAANECTLYLEFAQFLPFVNPLLLNPSLRIGLSRQLLRTFPRWRHFQISSFRSDLAVPVAEAGRGQTERYKIEAATCLDAWHWYFVTIIQRTEQSFWQQVADGGLKRNNDEDSAWRSCAAKIAFLLHIECDFALVRLMRDHIPWCLRPPKGKNAYPDSAPPLSLPQMAFNVLCRSGGDAHTALQALHRHAVSGSVEALYFLCGPVDPSEFVVPTFWQKAVALLHLFTGNLSFWWLFTLFGLFISFFALFAFV